MPPHSDSTRMTAPAKLRARPRAAYVLAAALVFGTAATAESATERVSAWTHADRTSARLVLEWARPVDYSVFEAGSYTFVRFSRPFTGTLEKARAPLARYLVELRFAGAGRVLVLRRSGEWRFTHQRRGGAVVLTWAAPTPARRSTAENPTDDAPMPARAARSDESAGHVSEGSAPTRPTVPPARRIESPSVPRADTPPPAPGSPRAEEAKLPQSPHKAPEPARAPQPPIRTAPEARPAPDGPIEPPVMPAISPTLDVTSTGGETRIVLAWPEPVAAAVFRHGERIWIIFPRREAFDVGKIGAQLGPGVDKLVRIEHAQATVLAAHVGPDVRARVAHERNVWAIVLKRESGAPEAPVVKIALSRAIAEQATVLLPGAEAPIRIAVPEASSKLHVVPSRARAAVAGSRTFVTFRVLAAAQGGVVEALADGLVVGAEGGAITIRRDAGLMLSEGSAQHGQ